MKLYFLAGFMSAFSVLLVAQSSSLPPDVDAQSFSRLPVVPRAQLDANGQRIYDVVNGKDATAPRLGPPAISMPPGSSMLPNLLRAPSKSPRTKAIIARR